MGFVIDINTIELLAWQKQNHVSKYMFDSRTKKTINSIMLAGNKNVLFLSILFNFGIRENVLNYLKHFVL